MMGTLMILGGMLMMLTPVTQFATLFDVFGMGQALRRTFVPEPNIPADMVERLHQLEDVP